MKIDIRKKIKDFFSSKKKNAVMIILLLLILIDCILGHVSYSMVDSLPDQNGAQRFGTTGRYAQVSAFFTQDSEITVDFIKQMDFVLRSKMIDAGITGEEAEDEDDSPAIVDTVDLDDLGQEDKKPEDPLSKVYTSCYSAQGIIDITYEKKKLTSISCIGVGGDFFTVHPLELVKGNYIDPDSLMKDGIVIDEQLAWNIFGSDDVVGQMVYIDEVPHYVLGVVRIPKGRIAKASGIGDSIAFITYDSLSKHGTILSGRNSEDTTAEDGTVQKKGGISCAEYICPNPVDGLLARLVAESAALDDKYITVIDNTDRFSGFALFKVFRSFGTRSMWNKAIYYPYWENIARAYEDYLAIIFMIRCLIKAVVIIILCIFVVRCYMHRNWRVSEFVERLMEKKYDLEVSINKKKREKGRKEL